MSQCPKWSKSTDQIIELANHEVETEWLRGLQEAGLTDLSVEEITRLATHEVEVEWLKEMRELGLFKEQKRVLQSIASDRDEIPF